MSNRAHPINWSIRYFPEKGALPFALILWGAYFVVVMGGAVTTAIIRGGAFKDTYGFMSQATVFLVVCSAALAAVTTLGFELEITLYRINDWSYVVIADQHAYGPNRFPGVYFKVWGSSSCGW